MKITYKNLWHKKQFRRFKIEHGPRCLGVNIFGLVFIFKGEKR
jgi:hypothetical protein